MIIKCNRLDKIYNIAIKKAPMKKKSLPFAIRSEAFKYIKLSGVLGRIFEKILTTAMIERAI